jgi:hypothetical protein
VLRCWALGLSLLSAACATPTAERWTKSGADDAATTKDMSECSTLAEQLAVRRYPYGFSGPSMSASGTVLSQQRDDTNRSIAQRTYFNDCMEDRGYTRPSAKQPGS